jgi:protein subunit release factor B
MPISPEKQIELQERMRSLGILEDDLVEKFILGSGSGGQKINKTSSCVYLKHLPTGFEVKCQKERSRELNRFYARREICQKVEELLFKQKSEKKQLEEKIRRQKQRKTRKQKQKMVEDKRQLSSKKNLRKPPNANDHGA